VSICAQPPRPTGCPEPVRGNETVISQPFPLPAQDGPSTGVLVVTTLPDNVHVRARVLICYDIAADVQAVEGVSTLAELLSVVETWWDTYWHVTDHLNGRGPNGDLST